MLVVGDALVPEGASLNRTISHVHAVVLVCALLTLTAYPVAAAESCRGRTPTIVGSEGPDLIEGTDGDDVVSALGGSDNVNTGAGNDVICGGDGDDLLFAGAGDDELAGDEGRDVLGGLEGADILDGGVGDGDMAYYNDSPVGVTIDLGRSTASGGHADGDTLVTTMVGGVPSPTLEAVNGSLAAGATNVLTGSAADNILQGGPGPDVLSAEAGRDFVTGLGGPDNLDGGDGHDTLDYSNSPGGVTIDLSTGLFSGGDAEGDVPAIETVDGRQVATFEDVRGSNFSDSLTGDHRGNRLESLGGNDTVTGGDGNETLNGGLGDDRILGEEGNDYLFEGFGQEGQDSRNGSDHLSGGAGYDIVDYGQRLNEVTATADGIADDGESGEGDNIEADVEDMRVPRVAWPTCNDAVRQQCVMSFTVDGAAPPGGIELRVSSTASSDGDIEVRQLDIDVIYDDGNPENNFEEIDVVRGDAPLKTTSEVRAVLNVGTFDPTVLYSVGFVEIFDYTFDEVAGNTAEVMIKPRPRAHVHHLAEDPDSGCTVTNCEEPRANADFRGVIDASLIDYELRPGASESRRAEFEQLDRAAVGTFLSTNAQDFEPPIFDDETGALEFRVAGPHLAADGQLNQGYLRTYVPDPYLREGYGFDRPAALVDKFFAVHERETVDQNVFAPSVRRIESSASARVASGAQAETTEGILIDMDGFDFSTPLLLLVKAGNDRISTGVGGDFINSGGGRDRIESLGGRDEVDGGGGTDVVEAGDGSDLLKGSGGNDTLKGGRGNDVVRGGSGVNVLNGGPGHDTCVSNDRRDVFRSCESIRRNHRRNHSQA